MNETHSRHAPTVVRSEEELRTAVERVPSGSVRARTEVEVSPVRRVLDRDVEQADVERVAVDDEGDDGEVWYYEDGSVSIPVLEEELVVTKRMRVRERILVRKTTTTEEAVVEADLRRERVSIDVDESVADRVDGY